jgi:VWFA-related protein
MSNTRSVFSSGIASLLVAACATHSTCATPQSLPSAPETPPTVLQTNSGLVLVDVVVTNKGKPVMGLKKSQFQVMEDGKAQAITSFDEHTPEAAPVAIAPIQMPPDTYTNRPAYPDASTVNVLLLDALNTPLADQMQARQQMLHYLKTLPPGTPMAVFTLASRLRMVQGVSADRSVLNAAVGGAEANTQPSPVLDTVTNQALDSAVADSSSLGASQQAISAMQQFEADNIAMQTDQRVRLTLQAMQQLARYTSGIPARKNLIWFSGSFPLDLDADISLDSPLNATRNYSEELRETSHLLSAARVAVYPVDARGLLTLPMADANYTASSTSGAAGSGGGPLGGRHGTLASGMPGFAKDNLKFMKQNPAEHASMLQVAIDTGGWAFFDTNGLEQAIDRILQHGSSYYTIGYAAGAQHLDGKFHSIQVKVAGANYELAYRRGYYADDPLKRFAYRSTEPSLVTATAHQAPAASEVLFSVHVIPPGNSSPDPLKHYLLDFNVDPHTLRFDTAADGSSRAQVEFIVIAYDRDGKRLNHSDVGYAFRIRPDQYSAAMRSGIPRQLEFNLPPGQLFLRVAIHDLMSNQFGAMEFPLHVVAP